ncbi:hypothetical protein [Streptomyces lasiicapitis]|uniref:hypothetical protein n=1 Tax=Streptomyces lasiicapitis TaxID=1923961 RepID=UPI003683C4DD
MTTIGFPPRSPDAWDRPAAEVSADAQRLAGGSAPAEPVPSKQEIIRRRRACRVLRDARAATHSPSDRIAYALDERLLAHPEAVATEADYPGWAERIAALATNNRKPRRAT